MGWLILCQYDMTGDGVSFGKRYGILVYIQDTRRPRYFSRLGVRRLIVRPINASFRVSLSSGKILTSVSSNFVVGRVSVP